MSAQYKSQTEATPRIHFTPVPAELHHGTHGHRRLPKLRTHSACLASLIIQLLRAAVCIPNTNFAKPCKAIPLRALTIRCQHKNGRTLNVVPAYSWGILTPTFMEFSADSVGASTDITTSCLGPSVPVLPLAYRPFSPLRKMGLLPEEQE